MSIPPIDVTRWAARAFTLLDEAGLKLDVEGDATVAIDEPLVKRALSNLLGNAARFAERGSTVRVADHAIGLRNDHRCAASADG